MAGPKRASGKSREREGSIREARRAAPTETKLVVLIDAGVTKGEEKSKEELAQGAISKKTVGKFDLGRKGPEMSPPGVGESFFKRFKRRRKPHRQGRSGIYFGDQRKNKHSKEPVKHHRVPTIKRPSFYQGGTYTKNKPRWLRHALCKRNNKRKQNAGNAGKKPRDEGYDTENVERGVKENKEQVKRPKGRRDRRRSSNKRKEEKHCEKAGEKRSEVKKGQINQDVMRARKRGEQGLREKECEDGRSTTQRGAKGGWGANVLISTAKRKRQTLGA